MSGASAPGAEPGQAQNRRRRLSVSQRLAAAESLAHVGTYEIDGEAFVVCSPEYRRIHGYAPDGPLPTLQDVLRRIHPDDLEGVRTAMTNSRDTAEPYEISYRLVRPDGRQRILRGRGIVEEGPDGRRLMHGAVQDISRQEHAVSRAVVAESRYSAMVEHANDGIWILDRAGRTSFVNRRLSEMLGRPVRQLLGRTPADLVAENLPDLGAERRTHFECRFERPSTADVWAMCSMSRLPAVHGGGTLLVVSDITVRKQMEERLREAAERDPLTGLLNRARFELVLDELADHAVRSRQPLALLFLDLDHFKYVNDSFGHSLGDALLREVAGAISQLVRDQDIVGRFGGDEFALALSGSDQNTAATVAERVLEAIRQRRWQTLSRLTASIGIALAGVEGRPTTRPELLVAADAALQDAKSNGRDQAMVYADHERGGFRWVDEIRAALEDERLVLYAQAIEPVRSRGGRRHELLIRLRDRDGSLVAPGAFIPAAEQFGLMVDIDRWVVRQGLGLARRGMAVQINLSGTSLGDGQIRQRVEEAISAGLEPNLLTFEVTETAAVRNLDTAREFAQQLRRLGCSFALDDFGTGFGSLTYLKHIPVSHLKIDMEFVRDITRSPEDQRLVRALVQMAQPLGLETVAEGVEDEPTYQLLRQIGVDYVQGYGIGMPFELELNPRSPLPAAAEG